MVHSWLDTPGVDSPKLCAIPQSGLASCWHQAVGTKLSKAREIEEITGIPKGPLSGLMRSSVAVKMSWASTRGTTRIEDEAYSLLGLFDINIPLLYGEGEKAFLRLQQEIIRSSDDESVLAWAARK